MFEKNLLERIGKKLLKKKQTVAVAESVTAGMLQLALSSIPDAAQFFQGGMTAYNIGQKYKHLTVEPVHALAVNCVSQQVADQMALNVAEKFAGDWGIGVCGYATPVPESGNKLFAFFAISYQGKIKAKGKIASTETIPMQVQEYYVNTIMKKWSALIK